MAVLYVRLPDDLRDTLKARAEAEGRSMSNLAVWLMRQQLEEPVSVRRALRKGRGRVTEEEHALVDWGCYDPFNPKGPWLPRCRCGWTYRARTKELGRRAYRFHKQAEKAERQDERPHPLGARGSPPHEPIDLPLVSQYRPPKGAI